MALEDRRDRDRAARRRLIVTTARKLAETEGWDAVTARRLSAEIEYSQPVLYKHFSGLVEIAQAVAIDGFGELAEVLSTTRSGAATPQAALRQMAHAYIGFARDNPALYDAMFTRDTALRFAAADTAPELSAAFTEVRRAVSAVTPEPDVDTATEVLWAALHGLATLTRGRRLRPGLDFDRVELLVNQASRAPGTENR